MSIEEQHLLPDPEEADELEKTASGPIPGQRVSYHGELLSNRLRKRKKHLHRWARKNNVNCYRLYDKDIPEIPLTIDLYEHYLHISEYPSQKELEAPDSDEWSAAMVDVAARIMGIPEARVFAKRRLPQKGKTQHERIDDIGERVRVHEGGYTFLVNLADYVDTGLFLDHRITRAIVASLCSGVRFLNLFSYTGSFTVYAAGAGARSTTSVDLSNTYNEWAAENLAVNGLAGPTHRFQRMEVFRFLAEARSRGDRYDCIVVDPPTFSNSKKMQGVLDLQRDHGRLLRDCLALLSRNGHLFFSTNNRRFRWAPADLPHVQVAEITKDTVDEDFRNRRPHRVWLLRHRSN